MEVKDLKNLSSADLQKKALEIKANLFKLCLQKNTSGLQKSHELKTTRKSLAKVLTVMNQKKESKK